MIRGEDYHDTDYEINPYESFMRKHLQHYGYYTGKNQNYKTQFQQYADWEKNYAYNLSSSSCSSSSTDSDSDDDEKSASRKLHEELLRTTQLIYSYGESGKMIPRLREPRSLYALNKELGPQQAARWPADMQVINEKVKHISTIPSVPEPFYKSTGFEKCPMVKGEASGGRIVYCYETHSSFFMKSRVGGSRGGCEPYSVKLESDSDTTLIFESRFESGNLGKAVQVGENEYELWLRYDLFTNKHTQWFYFRMSNTRADKEYRFTIVNFMKPDSLYNDGMKPLMYSEKEATANKVGWVRGGQDIKYYKNNLRYESGKTERNYYSMTWTTRFKHNHDTVYFSHCYPYTYTDLQDYLLELTNDPVKARICKQRVLCQSLAGNLVYVLTITSSSQKPEDMKHKKAVVVTSRVHPGESNASWMMKGFLDFLTGNSADAKLLRDTFIFKIVPMLNPDGVIVGNYRCSLAGRDLNRNFKTVLKDAYPSVWHTKTMIRKLLQERDIIVYCDLHGHSRRQNVFIYGCEQNHGSTKRFHEKVFPSMLSKNTPEKFCFNSCKFKVHKSKESTGRVVMWNLGIMNSYTMEATFCGSSLGKMKGFHFNQKDFEMMGYHFCDTLLDYCDPDNTKFTNILVDLENKHRIEVLTKMAQRGLQQGDVDSNDISTDTESSDGGSDSSASNGPPVHLQFTAARQPRKKKLRSKKNRDKVNAGKDNQKMEKAEEDERKTKDNQIKALKQDSNKPQGQPSKNTSNNTVKCLRVRDDRSASGIPVFVQERFEEKQQKRHNYLEALTAAYITNNIPFVNDPAFVKLDQFYTRGTKEDNVTLMSRQPQKLTLATADVWSPAAMAVVSQAGDSAFKICRLVGRMENHRSFLSSLERKHRPHLLEVSAAQQRQTDALLRDRNSLVKTHPNPFDEKLESAATVSRQGLKYKEQNGRKSRKEIEADNEEGNYFIIQGNKDVFDTKETKHLPKMKSANITNKTGRELSIHKNSSDLSALESFTVAADTNYNHATGAYLEKLIRETSDEIHDLTNEIQSDIQNKRLHKTTNAESFSTSDSKKSKPIDSSADEKNHQRMPLEIAHHGMTFVNSLQKPTESRHVSGHRRNPDPNANKGFNQIKSEAPSCNIFSGLESSSIISVGGLDLALGNAEHRELPMEGQARRRNLRRHVSLNTGTAGAYLREIHSFRETGRSVGPGQLTTSILAEESRDSNPHSYFQHLTSNSQTKQQSSNRSKSRQNNIQH